MKKYLEFVNEDYTSNTEIVDFNLNLRGWLKNI